MVSPSGAIMDLITECVKRHATDVKQESEGAYVTFPRFDRTTGLFGFGLFSVVSCNFWAAEFNSSGNALTGLNILKK